MKYILYIHNILVRETPFTPHKLGRFIEQIKMSLLFKSDLTLVLLWLERPIFLSCQYVYVLVIYIIVRILRVGITLFSIYKKCIWRCLNDIKKWQFRLRSPRIWINACFSVTRTLIIRCTAIYLPQFEYMGYSSAQDFTSHTRLRLKWAGQNNFVKFEVAQKPTQQSAVYHSIKANILQTK